MPPVAAVLTRSDDPEIIAHAVTTIGRSAHRLAVFEAIYKGQKQVKSVPDLMDATGLSEKQVRGALAILDDHHLCDVSGRGGGTEVRKDAHCRKYRDKIVSFVKDPAKFKSQPTKRSPTGLAGPSSRFTPKRPTQTRRRVTTASSLSVAYLTTNPDLDLRVSYEYKAVLQRQRESINRDKIELDSIAGASVNDLLRALNTFRPNVVHYSGHGSPNSILLNGEQIDDEAVSFHFGFLKAAVEATSNPPTLIVLNSCFGAIGASTLLGKVKAIVAMSNSIDDGAAIAFARQFYSALFDGQPISHAMDQGKLVLEVMGYRDAEYPKLIHDPSYDPTESSLV